MFSVYCPFFAALFTAFIPESPPCFENQEDASQKIRRSRHFSWKFSPQLPHSMKQVSFDHYLYL